MSQISMLKYSGEKFAAENRALPHERAIAISIAGSTHAVMMASPEDLKDFAFGFLLGDGVIETSSEIEDYQEVETTLGLDLQIRLCAQKAQNYQKRKRAMAGPVGCGLCGVESLELAVPQLEALMPMEVDQNLPWQALDALKSAQKSREISGALHGAGLLNSNGEMLIAREDIGRHNAVDKVIGAALLAGEDLQDKVMVLSSRVSLDLVVKAVRARCPVLIARASPSDLAFEYAQKWGLRLVAPVFEDEYFQNGERNDG